MTDALKKNWEIVGHRKLLLQLEKLIESQSLPQAILLRGPAGVGKSTTLQRFAAFLQGEEASQKVNLDTMFLEDDGHALKIETMRKAKEFMLLSRQGAYKICIIKNIERMTIPASNSFLKILEEPPKKAIFLLSSSNPDGLLDTIVSRCRSLNCETLNEDEIVEALSLKFPEKNKTILKELVGQTGLSLAKAVSLLENEEEAQAHSLQISLLDELSRTQNIPKIMKVAQDLAEEDRVHTIRFLNIFLGYAHKQAISAQEMLKVAQIQRTITQVERNANQRLSLEVLFLQYFTNLANI